jgi:hypothetical protein
MNNYKHTEHRSIRFFHQGIQSNFSCDGIIFIDTILILLGLYIVGTSRIEGPAGIIQYCSKYLLFLNRNIFGFIYFVEMEDFCEICSEKFVNWDNRNKHPHNYGSSSSSRREDIKRRIDDVGLFQEQIIELRDSLEAEVYERVDV